MNLPWNVNSPFHEMLTNMTEARGAENVLLIPFVPPKCGDFSYVVLGKDGPLRRRIIATLLQHVTGEPVKVNSTILRGSVGALGVDV